MRQRRYDVITARPSVPGSTRMLSAKVRDTGRQDLAREALGLRHAGILPLAPRLRWRSVHAG